VEYADLMDATDVWYVVRCKENVIVTVRNATLLRPCTQSDVA